ncbi:MAG: PDZ domain-containing protein [Acidobacteriota bacterium]|jgi:S1-C subfamily serine protease
MRSRHHASRPLLLLLLLAAVPASHGAEAEASRGFLGIRLEPVSDAVRAALALEEGAGVMVGAVIEGSAAEEAGLTPGDVILALDGRPVRGPRELMRTVSGCAPGDSLDLEIWREGQVVRGAVMLMARPDGRGRSGSRRAVTAEGNRLGITGVHLTDQLADYFVAPGGVLVARVAEGSAGEVAGLLAGDVIVSVDEAEISGPSELDQRLTSAAGPTVLLAIVRDGNDIFIEAALD